MQASDHHAAAPSQRAGFSGSLDSLMAATDAFRNIRAIALLGLTFVGAALIGGAFSALAASTQTYSLAAVGVVLALVIVFYGLNAVGIMMMKEAQGLPPHSIADAVLLSLFSSHRILAVVLLECLIVLGAMLAIALILLVCKIPVLGPILYTAVFPLAALVLGVLVVSLFYVMLPLTGPAVWNGSSVFQVIARLSVIVRTGLIGVVLSQVLLFVMAGFVALLIFGVVGTGVMMTTGMSAGILGGGMGGMGGMGGILSMLMGGGGGEGGGYLIAAGLGGSILAAVAAVIPALILTKGMCIIYLNVTRGLDFTASEAQLGDGVAAVRRHAEEAREKARQLAEQHRPQAGTPAAAAVVTTAATCPNCHATVAADDVFCGNCAQKLR